MSLITCPYRPIQTYLVIEINGSFKNIFQQGLDYQDLSWASTKKLKFHLFEDFDISSNKGN